MSSVASLDIQSQQSPSKPPAFERRLFVVLAVVALAYAFLAGLRTVSDFDLGWQMATGRWAIQQQQVPRVDVLSHTMPGQPWNYPIGGAVVFYLAYVIGGFGLISWIGTAACVGTIALLLRRNTAAGAALAILAVPLIAQRTTPRADMFSIVLFAAYLSLLWENYQTGKARLWLLPLLMVGWANLHFGFASGLALILAYVCAELLELFIGPERRRVAIEKLQRAWPWLAATFVATLVNPWGWNIYRGLLIEQRAYEQGQLWINEWAAVPINSATISHALLLRDSASAIFFLLGIAVVAGAFALFRGQWAAAILLLGATYPAVQHVRMGALFACVVVIAGGPQWSLILESLQRFIRSANARRGIAVAAVACFVLLASLRSFDLVTNRAYRSAGWATVFGPGLCSWFPTRAADFIRRESPPGEILNTYAAGGFLAWSVGPEHRVYIDGRDTLYGPPHLARLTELEFGSLDSQAWQDEVSKYNINTVVLALTQYDGVPPGLLFQLCNSKTWSPVYLDELAAVFVRRTPANDSFIQRFPANCANTLLPVPPANHRRGEEFNTWMNAGLTLAAVGRNAEAEAAFQKALAIDPKAASVHRAYGDLLYAMVRMDESEQEYLTAVKLDPSADTWGALARSYLKRNRTDDAVEAMEQEAKFAPRPYLIWQDLGYLYLQMHQPENAARVLDKAEHATPSALRKADNGFFEFKVAQGQAAAYEALGNQDRAIKYQEKAANLQPNVPAPWRRLAKMYEAAGRAQDALKAREHAAEAAK